MDPEHAGDRIRRTPRNDWRGSLGPHDYFNRVVHADWLCLSERAYISSDADLRDTIAFTPASDPSTSRVITDALVLVDRATRLVMVCLVTSHAEFSDAVGKWCLAYGTPHSIFSDGETANTSRTVQQSRLHMGIPFQRTNAPYHPHQNGAVETVVHALKQITARLCRDAGLSPSTGWPLAVLHAADIANFHPRKSLLGRCPLEILYGKPPAARYVHAFGCRAWVLALGPHRQGPLQPKALDAVYIGTGLRRGMSGALFLLNDGRTVVTQHYRVDEYSFPGITTHRPPTPLLALATHTFASDPVPSMFVSDEPERVLLTIAATRAGARTAPPCSRSRYVPPEDTYLITTAKHREIATLIATGTFLVLPSAPLVDFRLLPGIFVIKRRPDGTLALKDGAAKARLCMRGDLTAKSDLIPTYAPCIAWSSMLIFWHLVSVHRAVFLQCDIVNAYVQANLHPPGSDIPITLLRVTNELHDIFLSRLPGYTSATRHVRVVKALYGLRESGLLFHNHFASILRRLRFDTLGGEDCLFVLREDRGFLLLALHVDDFHFACCGDLLPLYNSTLDSIVSALGGAHMLKIKALTRSDQRYPGVDRVVAKPTPGRVG